jgi:hypothetical protein
VFAPLHRLVTVVVVVAFALSAGLRDRAFFWCPQMEQILADCCCPQAEADHDGPVLREAPCCEPRILLPEQQVSTHHPAEGLRAPAALPLTPPPFRPAVLPIEHRAATTVAVRARERGPRARSQIPLYDLHRSYLI